MRPHAVLATLVVALGCSLRSQGGSGAVSTVVPGIGGAIPPAIAVSAPAPGSWVTTGAVTLLGRAVAPSGLAVSSLSAAGVPAVVQTDGTFQVQLQLAPGIASVLLAATDAAGTTFATTVSYMVGPFEPMLEVPGAARIQLNASALPALERDVARALDGLDATALLVGLNPLVVQVLGGVVSVQVEFVSAAHGPSQVQLGLQSNALDVGLVIPGATVSIIIDDARTSLIPVRIPAVLTATSIEASAAATFSSSGGAAQATLGPAAVSIQGLTIQTTSPIDQVLAALLRSTVQGALEKALERCVAKDVPPIIDRTLAGNAKPLTLTIGGAALDLELRPQEILASPAGLEVTVAALASAGAAAGYPGVASSPPVLPTTTDVSVAVATDFLSEALVALHAAGALDIDIDAQSWPATLGPLDLQTIAALVPELASAGPGSTPVLLRVRPALPPLLEVGPGPDPFTLALGEARIEILADMGPGGVVPLLGVAAHTRISAALSLQGTTLAISTGPTRPAVDWSVVDQPYARVDETRLQVRLAVLFDALLPKLLARLSSIPLPATLGASIGNAGVSATGAGSDNLTVSGDLK
ncbi:MAG TPA: hypothetical protein VFF73_18860 [Planctomycetota bacterium]|nr:hypothetical protein [Planctomycetota bacterium]